MSQTHEYAAIGDHTGTLSMLRARKAAANGFTVLDVGASASPWTAPVLDAVFDLHPAQGEGLSFQGNINRVSDWRPVLDHVRQHGKFSYSVCSHTLEDVAYPVVALELLPQISEEGMIAVPSHLHELAREVEAPWRGYIHHRWMFKATANERLQLISKVPFVEHLSGIPVCPTGRSEFRLHWCGGIDFEVLNGDYLGPNLKCVVEMYERVLREPCE